MWNISGSFLWTRDRSDCINPLLNMENAYHSTELNSLWNMQYAMLPMTGGSIFDVFGQLQQNAYNAANAQMQAFLMALPQWGSGSVGTTPNVGTGLFPSFPGIMPTIPPRVKETSTEAGEDPKAPDNMSEADKEQFNKAVADYKEAFEQLDLEKLTEEDLKTLGIYNRLNNIKKKYSAADTAEKVRIAIQDLNDLLDPEKGIKEENLKKLLGEKKDILASTAGFENLGNGDVFNPAAEINKDDFKDYVTLGSDVGLHAQNMLQYEAFIQNREEKTYLEIVARKANGWDTCKYVAGIIGVANILKNASSEKIKIEDAEGKVTGTYDINTPEVKEKREALIEAINNYEKTPGDTKNIGEADEAYSENLTALITAYEDLYKAMRLALADAQDKAAKEALEAKDNLPDAIKELYKEDGEWKEFCNINRKAVEEELGV